MYGRQQYQSQPTNDAHSGLQLALKVRSRRLHDPDNFLMADAIRLWEALKGGAFDGNPESGLPWSVTEDADMTNGEWRARRPPRR